MIQDVWPRWLPATAATGLFFCLGLALAVGQTGCSSENDDCMRADEGDFLFALDPPESGESYSAMLTLTQVTNFPDNDPPQIQYRFRNATGARKDLQLTDRGRTLPVELDSTYTIQAFLTPGLDPPALGLKIFDGQGLRYLGVNDWRPNANIFSDGYGDLEDDGELRVFFTNTGCEPRVDNTQCYDRIINYRLDLLMGSDLSVGLWNGGDGRLGDWVVHVHKSSFVIAKQGCREGLLQQNGVSFTLERDGLR